MATCSTRLHLRAITWAVGLLFLTGQVAVAFPGTGQAAAPPGADVLKEIQYRYYFRGNYPRAIEELRAFLGRSDLRSAQRVEATEFLAASLILSGATEEGKALYVSLLTNDPAYVGPDPGLFQPVIMATYEQAKSEFASNVIRNAPVIEKAPTSQPPEPVAATPPGRPLYKKWWFYAAVGGALLVTAVVVGSGDDESRPDEGTLRVGIQLPE